MGIHTAPERPIAAPGETNNFAVDYSNVLDSGELLTGTPVFTEQTTSDLTIVSPSVSTASLVINGRTVSVGKAAQCNVSGQLVANSPYRIKIEVSTDSSPAQEMVNYVEFPVREG